MTLADELSALAARFARATTYTEVGALAATLHDRAEAARSLERWRNEALIVLGEWEAVWIAAGRPGQLGASKPAAVRQLFDGGSTPCGSCGGTGQFTDDRGEVYEDACPDCDTQP